MASKSVVLGEYKSKNLRITAQDSQKKSREYELVLKHGKNHKGEINEISALKKSLKFAATRSVDGFGISEGYKAVKLFNTYYDENLDPEALLSDIGLS